jgi:hypothetical protein
MPEWISKLSEPIKAIISLLQSHFWSIVTFVAALGWLLILLPNQVFVTLQIDGVRSTYLEAIGVVTFTSTSAIFFGVLYKAYALLKEKWIENERSRQREKLLQGLTPTEYGHLHQFMVRQSQTATFTIFDGVIAGLVEKGVVYKANSQANKVGEQDFNLYPWAYNYLRTHPGLFSKGVEHEKGAGQVG